MFEWWKILSIKNIKSFFYNYYQTYSNLIANQFINGKGSRKNLYIYSQLVLHHVLKRENENKINIKKKKAKTKLLANQYLNKKFIIIIIIVNNGNQLSSAASTSFFGSPDRRRSSSVRSRTPISGKVWWCHLGAETHTPPRILSATHQTMGGWSISPAQGLAGSRRLFDPRTPPDDLSEPSPLASPHPPEGNRRNKPDPGSTNISSWLWFWDVDPSCRVEKWSWSCRSIARDGGTQMGFGFAGKTIRRTWRPVFLVWSPWSFSWCKYLMREKSSETINSQNFQKKWKGIWLRRKAMDLQQTWRDGREWDRLQRERWGCWTCCWSLVSQKKYLMKM